MLRYAGRPAVLVPTNYRYFNYTPACAPQQQTACAAALGRPLAARRDVLKVLPAFLSEARLRDELKSIEAAAIIKVGRSFTKVRQVLRDLGLEPHAALVENATQASEAVYRLADVPDTHDAYFSTILVYRGGQSWH